MESYQLKFISNIISIAYADGKLSAAELAQIELIRCDLKLKKSDIKGAISSIEQGKHEMIPVGSFADQVKNLELMLQVAYADDDLNNAESVLIEDFANKVGIHHDQLGRMRSEAIDALKTQDRICVSCGTLIDVEARFCPKCGTDLNSKGDSISVDMVIPSTGLSIEFAESTAASFPKALELAKATSDFKSCLRNKKSWYLASYPSGDVSEAINLCESLSGIRNRRVYIDGKERLWDEVFGFVWCAARRTIAYRPIEYCFGKDDGRINPWGCRQANMEWNDWSKWFCYGRWEKVGIFGGKYQWVFDKDRIHHEIATNVYHYRFCPHLRTDLFDAVIKNLPMTIMPDSDHNWGYRRAYEQVPGAIKIIEKEGSGNYTYTNEYWSDGVRPKSVDPMFKILLKSLMDIGCNTTFVNALTK
ncbi:MAG: zinc-ribbon domain-containing protein [Syntrophaceae bacterium]|nr:zinc-ribbon domain-containing protein [Syntrophaceae bacterium]